MELHLKVQNVVMIVQYYNFFRTNKGEKGKNITIVKVRIKTFFAVQRNNNVTRISYTYINNINV